MNFTSDLEHSKQTNRLLVRILIGMFALLMLIVVGWMSVQNEMTVHIPPDLRTGAVMNKNEVHTSGVYLFAFYILQQINSWDENGATDYAKNISQMRHYLTPKFKEQLTTDVQKRLKNGELRYRIRSFHQIPGDGFSESNVEVVGNGWIVWLDVHIKETVLGQTVKEVKLRYPIKIVRYDADREMNPWGLALDGSGGYEKRRLTTTTATTSAKIKKP